MSNKTVKQTSSKSIPSEINGAEKQEVDEEKKNNRFSFMVGIVIAMVIIILFAIFFR